MDSAKIRKLFLEFFKDKGHAVVPSSSLVPENDPTTLFTGSGMQPMMPYLLGASHPLGRRIVNSQKCFRAEDIEEVGDNRHTTFFEMLGNWSFGDYWKGEQLSWFFEFLTEKIGLDPKKLYVTVFSGGEGFEEDKESIEIWQRLFKTKGIDAKYVELGTEGEAAQKGIKENERIAGYGVTKNWWSRSGPPANMPVGEPGGPDSEIFYEFTQVEHDKKFGEKCHPNCDCGRFLEIGNSVFMEFKKVGDSSFEKLPQRNVDFGGGLERITAASNNDPDIFKIDIFRKILSEMKKIYSWDYDSTPENEKRVMRLIADHVRTAVFMAGDGVLPSNKERGYVLRRILRRAIFNAYKFGPGFSNLYLLAASAIYSSYKMAYPYLYEEIEKIHSVLESEEINFMQTLRNGEKELKKIIDKREAISGKDAFLLFSTYGFPFELTEEIAQSEGITVSREEFDTEMEKHQKLSRTASAGMFKGGLADHSEETTRLHTVHHLLLKALQIVLGLHVKQRGSNITSERLRMDFVHGEKMTEEQKKKVEEIVNGKIAEDLPVIKSEMALEKAEKLGAEQEFGQKYPERVSVYSIGPKDAAPDNPKFDKAFSIEFCGGPHVSRTGEIGKFKIIKEEASSAGVRRIRATVE